MKGINSPQLLYTEEHVICSEYLSDQSNGFIYNKFTVGEKYIINDAERNYMLFFLEGKAEIHYDDNQIFMIKKNEFFFLPKTIKMEMQALVDIQFIVHVFDQPIYLCDKMAIQSLETYCNDMKGKIKILDIRHPLDNYFQLLSTYLGCGMLCRHMHGIKQKELFLLLRAFYTKEENAVLFAPIIDQSLDFRAAVMKNITTSKNVTELAQACNCSLTSFNRLFKKHFNTTPYKWVQQQKLNKIIAKLNDKTIPFTDIIDEFEFSSPAHFTSFCKKYLNTTPSQFQKAAISKREEKIDKSFKANGEKSSRGKRGSSR